MRIKSENLLEYYRTSVLASARRIPSRKAMVNRIVRCSEMRICVMPAITNVTEELSGKDQRSDSQKIKINSSPAFSFLRKMPTVRSLSAAACIVLQLIHLPVHQSCNYSKINPNHSISPIQMWFVTDSHAYPFHLTRQIHHSHLEDAIPRGHHTVNSGDTVTERQFE